jgi:hypothetical protein
MSVAVETPPASARAKLLRRYSRVEFRCTVNESIEDALGHTHTRARGAILVKLTNERRPRVSVVIHRCCARPIVRATGYAVGLATVLRSSYQHAHAVHIRWFRAIMRPRGAVQRSSRATFVVPRLSPSRIRRRQLVSLQFELRRSASAQRSTAAAAAAADR